MDKTKLKVAAVQMHASEDIEANTKKVVLYLKQLAKERVEVAAFSEGILFGYSCRPGFRSSFDPQRIVRAERRIIRTCKHIGWGPLWVPCTNRMGRCSTVC